MGNDGGSILKRRDLVKNKRSFHKIQINTLKQNKAIYCQLSKKELNYPVVFDKKGNFFNKIDLLKLAIEKDIPTAYKYLTKNRFKNLTLINEKSFVENVEFKIKCCLTGQVYTGLNPFVGIRKCGCIFSKKFFDEITNNDKKQQCPNCQKEFKRRYIIEFGNSDEQNKNILCDKQLKLTYYIQQIMDIKEIISSMKVVEFQAHKLEYGHKIQDFQRTAKKRMTQRQITVPQKNLRQKFQIKKSKKPKFCQKDILNDLNKKIQLIKQINCSNQQCSIQTLNQIIQSNMKKQIQRSFQLIKNHKKTLNFDKQRNDYLKKYILQKILRKNKLKVLKNFFTVYQNLKQKVNFCIDDVSFVKNEQKVKNQNLRNISKNDILTQQQNKDQQNEQQTIQDQFEYKLNYAKRFHQYYKKKQFFYIFFQKIQAIKNRKAQLKQEQNLDYLQNKIKCFKQNLKSKQQLQQQENQNEKKLTKNVQLQKTKKKDLAKQQKERFLAIQKLREQQKLQEKERFKQKEIEELKMAQQEMEQEKQKLNKQKMIKQKRQNQIKIAKKFYKDKQKSKIIYLLRKNLQLFQDQQKVIEKLQVTNRQKFIFSLLKQKLTQKELKNQKLIDCFKENQKVKKIQVFFSIFKNNTQNNIFQRQQYIQVLNKKKQMRLFIAWQKSLKQFAIENYDRDQKNFQLLKNYQKKKYGKILFQNLRVNLQQQKITKEKEKIQNMLRNKVDQWLLEFNKINQFIFIQIPLRIFYLQQKLCFL